MGALRLSEAALGEVDRMACKALRECSKRIETSVSAVLGANIDGKKCWTLILLSEGS